MKKKKGKKPDYRLKFWNKATGEKGTVGAVWKGEDGNLHLKLEAKVVLQQTPVEQLTIFPVEFKKKKR
jgi:hypothetical protein